MKDTGRTCDLLDQPADLSRLSPRFLSSDQGEVYELYNQGSGVCSFYEPDDRSRVGVGHSFDTCSTP